MERQEQLHHLRARILQAEEDRLHGTKTMNIVEAREALKRLPASVNADSMTVDELRTELLAGYTDMINENVQDASIAFDRFRNCETRKGADGVEDFSNPSA